MKFKKSIGAVAIAIAAGSGLVACSSDADVASHNLSKQAEDFQINRRIVAYDSISKEYPFEITGRCSVEFPADNRAEITCKQDDGQFTKNFVSLGDNVTLVVEQTNGMLVDTGQYGVNFKPESIIPNVDRN